MKKGIYIILLIIIFILVIISCYIYKNDFNKIKDKNGYYITSSTINRKESKYDNPIIPKGFKTVNTKSSKWTIENNKIRFQDLYNGLVIEDKKGNQFVWIPVDGKTINLSRKIFQENNIKRVKEGSKIDRIYYSEENMDSCLAKYKYNNKDYSITNFKKSVKKYGGFYIARYETGKNNKNIPVSQSNKVPFTNITRDEALKYSMNFIKNSDSVISSLVNSYAWDTTLEFINEKNKGYILSKEKVGNNTLKSTGENEDASCNIYDLSGNVREWTTEYSSNGYYSYTSSCVIRGGYYNNSDYTASSRYYNGENIKNNFIGYRMILYIKVGELK